jgi:ubiquinone/menaquinone biosynthesis C-methylase UbiE
VQKASATPRTRASLAAVNVDPKAIIESGYDAMAEQYLATFVNDIPDDPRIRFIGELTARLPAGARVLELGCGAGIPGTALLARHHDVLGIDISATQLSLAARHVPNARFRKADMTSLAFPDSSFDAVTAFYCFNHIPRAEQPQLLADIARWLRPGGYFLASFGNGASDDTVETWLSVPMFFASHAPAVNRANLSAAGFTLLIDEVVTTVMPPGPEAWQWVLAATAGPQAGA